VAFLIISTTPTYAAGQDGQQLDVPKGDASLNWSGYVAQKDANYTSVTGTWVVPSVSANTQGTADATWVGIGGVNTRDLIQAGTQAIIENGTVTYSAWIETLPGFSKTVSLAVHSGDSVTATLTEESAGVWRVTLQNNTDGTSYSSEVAYDSSHSSAEWVEEMVSNADGTFRPLDSFGTVGITNASATVNGTNENLSQLGATPLQMVNGAGQTLASASSVGTDNASFSVTRGDALAIDTQQQYQSGQPMVITIIRTRHGRGHRSYTSTQLPAGFTFSIVRL
jgi:hypothetical protein